MRSTDQHHLELITECVIRLWTLEQLLNDYLTLAISSTFFSIMLFSYWLDFRLPSKTYILKKCEIRLNSGGVRWEQQGNTRAVYHIFWVWQKSLMRNVCSESQQRFFVTAHIPVLNYTSRCVSRSLFVRKNFYFLAIWLQLSVVIVLLAIILLTVSPDSR